MKKLLEYKNRIKTLANQQFYLLIDEYKFRQKITSFDHNDLKENILIQKIRFLQGLELVLDGDMIRKIFKIQKKEFSANYVTILRYIMQNQYFINQVDEAYLETIKNEIIQKLASGDAQNGLWLHPYSHHGQSFKKRDILESCQYHNIHALNLLIDIKYDPDLITKKINAMMEYHWNGNYFTYYPGSNDNTLNLQAETIKLLLRVEKITNRPKRWNELRKRLTELLLDETDPTTGLWRYTGSNSFEQINNVIDLHHNCMIIRALYDSDVLSTEDLKDKILCLKNTFYDFRNDKWRYSNKSRNETRIDGYIELLKLGRYDNNGDLHQSVIRHLGEHWLGKSKLIQFKKFGGSASYSSIRFGPMELSLWM